MSTTIDRSFLKKWGACWSESRISALGVTQMTARELIERSDVTWRDKNWVICRLLVTKSRSLLVEYANFCRDSAKKYAAADYAARAADYAARAADYAADADYAAAADYAADYAAYAADYAAAYAADAARTKEYKKNLEFALSLLESP